MSESKNFPPNIIVKVIDKPRIAVSEFTAEKGEVVAISADIPTEELSPGTTAEKGERVTVRFDIPQSGSLERSAMLFCRTRANGDTPGENWALATLKDFEPKLHCRDLGLNP